MSALRALVLRAPGINCDREAAQACRLAGFETDLVHINQLIKDPNSLLDYQFLVIPGGFSYGDDLGAGTLLAKNLTIHLGNQLRHFIDEGYPVLGICNGFQVLVRAGLLPGHLLNVPLSEDIETHSTPLRATLTENASAMFECRWVSMAVQPGPCIFTHGIERPIEMPVAHGEGQFVLEDAINRVPTDGDKSSGDPMGNSLPTKVGAQFIAPLVARLQANGQVPLVYIAPDGDITQSAAVPSLEVTYPANPNGSLGNVAGVCNARGNVFGLMPHPERFVTMLQHPQRRSSAGRQADGLLIFKNAYEYALQCLHNSPQKIHQDPSGDLSPEKVGTRFIASVSYADSGVDIAAGEKAIKLMKDAVRATQGPEVLAGIGAFAGVFSAKALQKMRRPVLVSSTDGVGTKTLIAAQDERYDTIGYDLVNHSINDLLMQGARPLFFMDYIAMGKLDPVHAATTVKGIANACREAGCALLGGETAEMPDVYLPGAFDLAGTMVGVAEEDEIVNGSTISAGDVILGLPSNGLHTNGYSLARRVFASYALGTVFPELGEPLVDALLRPHRSYLQEITQLRDYLADRGRYIKGMAHITGGGFEGNITRILPSGMQAVIDSNAWSTPPLFQLIARLGGVPQTELYRALNMGIGVIIVLSPKSALEARCVLPELLTIGTIVEGEGVERVSINSEVVSDDTNI
jgi:phosphoribosylaminoimidazole synthetase